MARMACAGRTALDCAAAWKRLMEPSKSSRPFHRMTRAFAGLLLANFGRRNPDRDPTRFNFGPAGYPMRNACSVPRVLVPGQKKQDSLRRAQRPSASLAAGIGAGADRARPCFAGNKGLDSGGGISCR